MYLLPALVLFLSGCGFGPSCRSIDAQGVVQVVRPKAQFRSMLERVVDRTQTAAMVRARDGSAGGEALAKAIDGAVERHHREWEQNLVASWSELDKDEITQVCSAMGAGDRATFDRFATRVGVEVQRRNEPLLQRAAAEVLIKAYTKP